MISKSPIKKQGGAEYEYVRASLFNKDLSNETTFSLIHLAGL